MFLFFFIIHLFFLDIFVTVGCHPGVYPIRSIPHSRFGQSHVFVAQSIRKNCKSWRPNWASGSFVCVRWRRDSEYFQKGRNITAQVSEFYPRELYTTGSQSDNSGRNRLKSTSIRKIRLFIWFYSVEYSRIKTKT